MDDIARKWDHLSLNQKESQTVSLTLDVTGDGRVLVAKFFTKRHINMEAVFRTLQEHVENREKLRHLRSWIQQNDDHL